MIKIFDSLSNKKHEFKPIHPGKIHFYACGITVYDYCHIGHARATIVFDVVVRYLRHRGFEVDYVHNITDVDDKIIQRAKENNETCEALTERFIKAMHEDEQALGVLPPTHEPRATQYMPQIIRLVKTLVDKNAAYVADNGDVCFAVRGFNDYGKLSKRHLDDLVAGDRAQTSQSKRDPLDFVLWKLSKPGEPQWDSPWGKGRPGWHIECSAMSTDLLGQPFDIHGGGMDLKFPHHENEIAQSEAACEKGFANHWMHVGLLQINGEKMSKSLGNFLTIRDALKQHDAETIRYFMIASHYRSPVDYSESNLQKVMSSLRSLYTALRDLPIVKPEKNAWQEKFKVAMDDDFNTPEALATMFALAHEVNRLREKNELEQAALLAANLRQFGEIFGILQQDPEIFLQGKIEEENIEKIEALIAVRNQARADKQWDQADQARDKLMSMGIVIEDGANGTTWRKA